MTAIKVIVVTEDGKAEDKYLSDKEMQEMIAISDWSAFIDGELYMWGFSKWVGWGSGDTGYNSVANELYIEHRGIEDVCIAGPVMFADGRGQGKSITEKGEQLLRSYLEKVERSKNA